MPEVEDDAPFVPEPLFANGGRIFTMDMGLNLCSVQAGPENGLTRREARGWAALLAAAPAMQALLRKVADECGPDSPLTQEAALILFRCEPKPKGLPFKRLGPKVGTERRLNVQVKGAPSCATSL